VFRQAGTQASPVTMSSSPLGSTLLAAIKKCLKEEEELLSLAFCFCLLGLYYGLLGLLLFRILLLAFWCGKLLEGKIIVEGKMLMEKWKIC
jgi:hypothetical protein